MKALFLLIALYTITGKQAVTDGSVPDGSSCIYEQSGTKSGQMTAGNTIDLVLTGYDGATISSVTLMMHSNTSAGAGALTMQVGNKTVWQIADGTFASSAWHGAYSTDWVPVVQSFTNLVVPSGAEMSLHLSASVNSLYLQSVQIDYSMPAAQPCTVRFDTHINLTVNPITESVVGAGIILPDFHIYDADWQFYGWLDQPVVQTDVPTLVYSAGANYYPAKNCTLHALYVHEGEAPEWYAVDSVQTGAYLMTAYVPALGEACLLRAYGAVDNGRIWLSQSVAYRDAGEVYMPGTAYQTSEVYNLTRSSDTTVTIRHADSGKYVTLGKNNKFTVSSTTRNWCILPYAAADAPQGAFTLSQEMDGQVYYIAMYCNAETESFYLRPSTDEYYAKPMLFFATQDAQREPAVYTSYPYGNGVDQTAADLQNMTDYILDLGIYTLHIHNGKKTLQLK